MTWELEEVGTVLEELDDCGFYVTIHRVEVRKTHKQYAGTIVQVRLDLMQSEDHEPIRSFVGSAKDVARAVVRYCGAAWTLSREHAAYIGGECMRAEMTEGYVQD